MNVYVIEAGEYSSRSVVGVVETEKEAEKIVDILKRSSSEEVTFTKFNTKQFQTETLCFRVDFNYGYWEVEYVKDTFLINNSKENYEEYEDCWIIYAATPEQAIKIAQDMRAKRLALKSNL